LANYYDSINAGTCADYIRTALATPSGAPDSGESLREDKAIADAFREVSKCSYAQDGVARELFDGVRRRADAAIAASTEGNPNG
jgi:hypothetical protein